MSYLPTIADVLRVKIILRRPIPQVCLPLEIIDLIVDHASYWPHTTVEARSLEARGNGSESASNVLCLRTWPLGAQDYDPYKAQEVEETTTSKWWKWDFWAAKLGMTKERAKAIWVPPRGAHPCRKIVFELKSHDQGYTSEMRGPGEYDYSWTWFDAGIETTIFRPSAIVSSAQGCNPDEVLGRLQSVGPSIPWLSGYDPTKSPHQAPKGFALEYQPQIAETESFHPFLPPQTRVQSNATAHGNTKTHIITWSYTDCFGADSPEADEAAAMGRGRESLDGAFVKRLRTGDCVTLWARARFPGWTNTVEQAKVHVFWAV